VAALKEQDPILVFAGQLRESGVLTDAIDERLRTEVKAEVNEASQRAEARPGPDVATAERFVYAEAD
jgi:TPP-dependent pyruvate/acetoin dehydrogenase alpha subunit